MGEKNKVNITGEGAKIKSAAKHVDKASNLVNKAYYSLNAINSLSGLNNSSAISTPGIMVNVKDSLASVTSKEKKELDNLSDILRSNSNLLAKSDIAEHEERKSLEAQAKSLKIDTTGLTNDEIKEKIRKKQEENKTKKKKKKKKKATQSIVTTGAVNTGSTVSKSTSTTKSAKKKLVKKYKKKLKLALKKNKKKTAVKYYNKLASLIGVKKADKYLKTLGYEAIKKDKKVTTIKKVVEKAVVEDSKNDDNGEQVERDPENTNADNNSDTTSNDTTTQESTEEVEENNTNTVNSNTNNDNNNTTAQTTDNTTNNTEDKNPNETVAIETPVQENTPSTTETVSSTPSNSNESNNYNSNNSANSNSSNNYYQESSSYNDGVASTPEVSEPSSNVSDVISDTTAKEPPKVDSSKPNSNVVSITDDAPSTTSKRSGIGSAIPIGLGTIAAGAAAVAGVRYVKNRHDSSEEYDESYDDEENNLDSDSGYVDSAQYDSGPEYMNDDYLGPSGSTYEEVVENDYIDPEDLESETADDFSNDSVLEELDFNEGRE